MTLYLMRVLNDERSKTLHLPILNLLHLITKLKVMKRYKTYQNPNLDLRNTKCFLDSTELSTFFNILSKSYIPYAKEKYNKQIPDRIKKSIIVIKILKAILKANNKQYKYFFYTIVDICTLSQKCYSFAKII